MKINNAGGCGGFSAGKNKPAADFCFNKKIEAERGRNFSAWKHEPTCGAIPLIRSRRKGQSILLTHAILISFAIFLVFAVFTTLTTLRTDFEDFVADKEVQQTCLLVKGAIEKIYVPTDYRSPDNTTTGKIVVQMPERIAGTAYRLGFINASVEIDARPFFNTTCKAGFAAVYNGSSSGGRTQLKYVRYSNGTDNIEMSNV